MTEPKVVTAKQMKLNRIAGRLKKIETEYGDTAGAWMSAYRYLSSNGIDDYFLTAVGIDTGANVKGWLYDYYIADRNADQKTINRIKSELPDIDEGSVYLADQGLDAYNHGAFTPDSVEPAGADTISESFRQMIQSLHDFPERY